MSYLIKLFRINFMYARVLLLCTAFSICMAAPVFAEEIVCKIAVAPFAFALPVENQEAPEIAEFAPKFKRYLEKALKKQPNIKLVQSPQMQSLSQKENYTEYRRYMYNTMANTYAALDCDYVIFGELISSETFLADGAPPKVFFRMKVTVCRKNQVHLQKRFEVMHSIPDEVEEKDIFLLKPKFSWARIPVGKSHYRIPVGKSYYDKALQEMADGIAKEIQSHIDDDGSLIVNAKWRKW